MRSSNPFESSERFAVEEGKGFGDDDEKNESCCQKDVENFSSPSGGDERKTEGSDGTRETCEGLQDSEDFALSLGFLAYEALHGRIVTADADGEQGQGEQQEREARGKGEKGESAREAGDA